MARVSKKIAGRFCWIVIILISLFTWLFYSSSSEINAYAISVNVLSLFNKVSIDSLDLNLTTASLLVLNIRIAQFYQEFLYFIIVLITLFILAILVTFSSKKGIAVFGWITFGFFIYCFYSISLATLHYQNAILINTWKIMESIIDSILSNSEKNAIIMCLLLLNISYNEIPVYLYYLLAGLGISVILTIVVNVSSQD